jgi:hypothetical protein
MSLCKLCRSRVNPVLLVILFGVLGAAGARASVIVGPVLSTSDSGYQDSGLGFTAVTNATLTSFTFQNQGQADNILLVDSLGNILDSVATAASTPSDTVSINWALTAGQQYYLLQSTLNNSHYVFGPFAAPSNAEIALTDTGDFSQTSRASANFTFGGAAGSGTATWAAFNNITTSSSSSTVPEPGSLSLLLPGALAIWWRAKRKGLIG